ncbi:MAG: queuine tRNA-ribosyltransferase family protein [Ardenticatenaceae bacterium]|nr:queuine tRNA-ribosyltransferase family protein [Ardenticatenaceae bacterium]
MKQFLDLPHGRLPLPAFLPDGTQGVVRSVDAQDLLTCGVQAVQMNVFHLMQRPGSSTIQALGGLHQMAGWERPLFTDSGGFQVYSLIRQNPKSGSIGDKGATFRIEGHKYNFTPEKSIQLQMSYGADVVICLDDCTHVDDPDDVQAESVRRTVAWARRCKVEFERLADEKKLTAETRPKLVAVVQGGGSRALRRQCAEELLAIGFDGYGYGGWPLDGEGNLLTEILAWVRELVPAEFTVHALGVGHPENVATCAQMGYELFDSTMPTRDARHGRLYAFTQEPDSRLTTPFFRYVYVKDDKHIKDGRPISPFCDCPACRHYSLGYLHHLYKINDSLYPRLATMHNLRFMTQLMAGLSREIRE